jgi:septal ring factor EnvC (AmiA/AmiB activator)
LFSTALFLTQQTTEELKAPPAIKKPDRNVVKEKEDKLRDEMAKLEAKIKVVSDKAKAIQQQSSGNDDGLSDARSRLKELKVMISPE